MTSNRTVKTNRDAPHAVDLSAEALEIHRSAILVDGHNDLPWRLHEKGAEALDKIDLALNQPTLQTDIPRLRRGGVGAQFWAVYVPTESAKPGRATRLALEQIDLIYEMARRYPDTFEMARTADDIERIHRSGRIASLIGIEGGYLIEGSLETLRTFHRLGARYMTLTHSDTIDWADSATDEARHGGLTEFGGQVVLEMNRLGMMVDISHVSVATMNDVLRVSRSPIIASHSSAYALVPHPRNIPDDVLRKVADNGGIVMVNFFSGFIDAEGARVTQRLFDARRGLKAAQVDEAELERTMKTHSDQNPIPRGEVRAVVDHIDHIVRIAGIDHVGLGSDFDGVTILPQGLEDVSCFPNITRELLTRGYPREAIHKILGANILRVMRRVEMLAESNE